MLSSNRGCTYTGGCGVPPDQRFWVAIHLQCAESGWWDVNPWYLSVWWISCRQQCRWNHPVHGTTVHQEREDVLRTIGRCGKPGLCTFVKLYRCGVSPPDDCNWLYRSTRIDPSLFSWRRSVFSDLSSAWEGSWSSCL